MPQDDYRNWANLPKALKDEWICFYCYFLCYAPHHSTSIESLRAGIRAGRQCCNVVLDALLTWEKHTNRALHGACVFAWKSGCDKHVSDPNVSSSIVLHWPSANDDNEETAKEPVLDVVLNLFFRQGMTYRDAQHSFAQSIDTILTGQNVCAPDIASYFPFPMHYLPSGDTSSSKAFDTIRGWMDTCVAKHTVYCPGKLTKRLPKRVLELTDSHFYLRELSTAESIYACLSHCWGEDGPVLQLRSHNLDGMKNGIPISNLPRTFSEAMSICLRLGIRYVWIDALCKSC